MQSYAMPPYKLRRMLLNAARDMLKTLNSSECMMELYDAPEKEVSRWAHSVIQARRLRNRLEKQQLSEIRDPLIKNEHQLNKGASELDLALANFNKLKPLLDTAELFFEIVKTALVFI